MASRRFSLVPQELPLAHKVKRVLPEQALALTVLAEALVRVLVLVALAAPPDQVARQVKAHLFLLRLWRASGVMMILLLLQRAILLEPVCPQTARRSR
jgi:hypothetical protein